MKPPPAFTSQLAERMIQFIAFKRMQGYDYNDGTDRLERFDAFLSREGDARRLLQIDQIHRYRADIGALRRTTQVKHLSTVRQFSLYLHALEPESTVLPIHLVPRQPRAIRFHPLSPKQVGDLMAATSIFRSDKGIRAPCIRFLVGLLYCTGLRIGEALALTLGDVNAKQATLFVRRGKFHKERIVPMSASTLEALNRWMALRSRYAGNEGSSPLLVVGWHKRLKRDQAAHAFARLCAHCGIAGEPSPRLHDLRHNYACQCLALWRETQEDVDALLPVLANAMGHVGFHATQVYIHIDADALHRASVRFRTHATPCLEHST